jgi:plasmid stabilization system protein ParE
MRYEFHPEALQEYDEAAHYYAKQKTDLDLRFIRAVETTIEVILDDPSRWRAFHGDVRRCFTRIFPYGILYTIEADYVLIVAVAHFSREPGYWEHRLA